MLSAVVIAAVALYLYLASRIFYEDKTLLIYELNQTNVRALGADLETYFQRIRDKFRMVERLHQMGAETNEEWLKSFTGEGEDFVKIGMIRYRASGERWEKTLKTWPKALELQGKDEKYLEDLRQKLPIPFQKVVSDGMWVRNAVLPGPESPALMTVAAVQTDRWGKPMVVYADLKLDRVLERFSRSGIAEIFLVDSEGFTLAHSQQNQVMQAGDLKTDALVKAAMASKLRSEVKRVDGKGNSYLGSFYKVGMASLVVGSKVAQEEAFAAARLLMKKSLLYALVVITGAFLIALFLSHSLTEPIQRLVEATRRLAQGDFNLVVPISSRDEIAVLASSFNSMTSDLKSSREQIEEYSRTLEQKVIDRTARLEASNIAIKEAQEALVRTTRLASVGEVAGRAAHEVLNPLTSIVARLEKIRGQGLEQEKQDLALFGDIVKAWSELLQAKGRQGLLDELSAPSGVLQGKTLMEEDLENLANLARDSMARSQAQQADIDFLLKEAARINKIVNGMRQLTRVSGERGNLSVHAVLDEAMATMTDLLSKNGIKMEKAFSSGAPAILGDRDELIQVLTNLFRNSMQAILDARKKGLAVGAPAKIWVSTQEIALGDGTAGVRVRVSDNGPGIPAQNWHQIFEPSFTTKSMEEGTGLGLSIARRFIRAHEGELTLEKSEPAVETSFVMDLPQVTEQNDG